MSIEDENITKWRIVEHSVLARGAALATRQALASASVLRDASAGEPLFRQSEPAAHVALIGQGHVRHDESAHAMTRETVTQRLSLLRRARPAAARRPAQGGARRDGQLGTAALRAQHPYRGRGECLRSTT